MKLDKRNIKEISLTRQATKEPQLRIGNQKVTA